MRALGSHASSLGCCGPGSSQPTCCCTAISMVNVFQSTFAWLILPCRWARRWTMGWERYPLGWSWRMASRASLRGLPGTSTQGMIPGQPRHLADLHIWCYLHTTGSRFMTGNPGSIAGLVRPGDRPGMTSHLIHVRCSCCARCMESVPLLLRKSTFCDSFFAHARVFRTYQSWVLIMMLHQVHPALIHPLFCAAPPSALSDTTMHRFHALV